MNDPLLNETPWTGRGVKLDWGGEAVRVVDDDSVVDREAVGSGLAEPVHRLAAPPARLVPRPSADDHHNEAVKALIEAARLAIDSIDLPKTGAKAWARSLGYDPKHRVVKAFDEAVAAIHDALDIVDAHENG